MKYLPSTLVRQTVPIRSVEAAFLKIKSPSVGIQEITILKQSECRENFAPISKIKCLVTREPTQVGHR